MDHNAAYDEILKWLQDAELAARNKQYLTSMNAARNAADVAKKRAVEDDPSIINRRQ